MALVRTIVASAAACSMTSVARRALPATTFSLFAGRARPADRQSNVAVLVQLLHRFDQFVTRELSCRACLRYVDDFAVFGDGKRALWAWKARSSTG
jgi:hypothetical protein